MRALFVLRAFAATLGLCLLLIHYIDEPVARALIPIGVELHFLTRVLGAPVLLTVVSLTLLYLIAGKIRLGGFPQHGRVLLLAGFAVLIVFALNAFLLKPLFGRQPVSEYLFHRAGNGFDFLHGSIVSSFPSTHAAMTAAALTVLGQAFPKLLLFWGAALLLICIALIVGDWHFASDVVAGVFVGWCVGLVLVRRIPTN